VRVKIGESRDADDEFAADDVSNICLYWNVSSLLCIQSQRRYVLPLLLISLFLALIFAFSALTLLVGWQEWHPACKKQWWGAGMVICLELGADLHMAQLMPLPLTVSCFYKIQIGFTFLVPADLGSPGKRAVKRVYFSPYISEPVN